MNTPFQLKKLSTKNDVKAMVLLRIAYMQVGQNVLIVRIFFQIVRIFCLEIQLFLDSFQQILHENFTKKFRQNEANLTYLNIVRTY